MKELTNAATVRDWLEATKGIAISAHVDPKFLVPVEKEDFSAKGDQKPPPRGRHGGTSPHRARS